MKVMVLIDARKCMANQMCRTAAPGLFELGAAGYARTTRADQTDFTEDDLPLLLAARDQCPTGAIHIETADDDIDDD